jgi:hypothetical protein
VRAWSKGFKRRVVSFSTAVLTLVVYIPFMDARWAIYAARCVGYTTAVFGLAWSDGKMHQFFAGKARSVGEALQTHLVFLLMVILWIWLAQYSKPTLPAWVTAEGDRHESWFLVFALLGIVGLLLFEHWWFSKAPKRDLQYPHDHTFQGQ